MHCSNLGRLISIFSIILPSAAVHTAVWMMRIEARTTGRDYGGIVVIPWEEVRDVKRTTCLKSEVWIVKNAAMYNCCNICANIQYLDQPNQDQTTTVVCTRLFTTHLLPLPWPVGAHERRKRGALLLPSCHSLPGVFLMSCFLRCSARLLLLAAFPLFCLFLLFFILGFSWK